MLTQSTKNKVMAKHGKPKFFSLFYKTNLGNGCKMNHLTSKALNKHFHFQKKHHQNQSSNFP